MRLVPIAPLALAATLALAACNAPPAEENVAAAVNNAAAVDNAANAANALNYIAEIGNLSEDAQKGVFFRAVRDAGLPCQDITKLQKDEPMNGVPTWRVDCDGDTPHLIQVKPDGSAQVISRN